MPMIVSTMLANTPTSRAQKMPLPVVQRQTHVGEDHDDQDRERRAGQRDLPGAEAREHRASGPGGCASPAVAAHRSPRPRSRATRNPK